MVQVKVLREECRGVTMPEGMGPAALTSALLIFWCYAMELPLPENVHAIGGTA